MGKRYIIFDNTNNNISKGKLIQEVDTDKVFKSKLELAQTVLKTNKEVEVALCHDKGNNQYEVLAKYDVYKYLLRQNEHIDEEHVIKHIVSVKKDGLKYLLVNENNSEENIKIKYRNLAILNNLYPDNIQEHLNLALISPITDSGVDFFKEVENMYYFYKGDFIPINVFLNIRNRYRTTLTVSNLDLFFKLFENPVSLKTIKWLSSCFNTYHYLKYKPNLANYSEEELMWLYRKSKTDGYFKTLYAIVFSALLKGNAPLKIKKTYLHMLKENSSSVKHMFNEMFQHPEILNDSYLLYHILDFKKETLDRFVDIVNKVNWKGLKDRELILDKFKAILKIYFIQTPNNYKSTVIKILRNRFTDTYIKNALDMSKDVDISIVDNLSYNQLLDLYSNKSTVKTTQEVRERFLLEYINNFKSFELISKLSKMFYNDLYELSRNNDKDIDLKGVVFIAQEVLKSKGVNHILLKRGIDSTYTKNLDTTDTSYAKSRQNVKRESLGEMYSFMEEDI